MVANAATKRPAGGLSMDAQGRFWRLVGAYERLTQDEAAALHAEDFDTVLTIQTRKSPILEELPALMAAAEIDRREPRLAAVEAREFSNQQMLAEILQRSRAERQHLEKSRLHLRGLSGSYKHGTTPQPHAFCAHG